MTEKIEKTPKELSIEKAEGIVIAIGIYLIFFDVISLLMLPGNRRTAFLFTHLIQWLITFGLCFLLYRGKRWARMLLAFLLVLSTLFSIYTIYRLIVSSPQSFWIIMYMLVFLVIPYGLFAYLLLFSSDIDELIRSRNA